MKVNNVAALRGSLEQMTTQQLDIMLHEELMKEPVDGQTVRLIMSILEKREQNVMPEIDGNVEKAWERYQKRTQPVHKKPKHLNSWLLKAASLMLVLFALATLLPQEAKAMSFFERFVAWTESVFSLISPAEAKEREAECVFQTDNPGLQDVYDKVTELGVTVPVVPMWLPEGYELVECKVTETFAKDYLSALFLCGDTYTVLQFNIYSDNVTYEYYKDDAEIYTVEQNGITYFITHNADMWIAIWTIDNLECTIATGCQEDDLHHILESINTMEG